tara:strand:+ start:230 stop:1096 length:867 start_codon:yes stop_codon:yes gene_type:complete
MLNTNEIADVGYNPLPTTLEDLSEDKLKKLIGQSGDTSTGGGMPRLSINHSTEDDDGNQIPRGFYMIKNSEGKSIFAPKVTYRPFVRTFMYSVWDNDSNSFGGQTIQSRSMNDLFYDTNGGLKCGKLAPNVLKTLDEHSPDAVLQKSIKCVQVLYGLVSIPEGQDATGNSATVKDIPCVWYVRGSSFMRISDWIKSIEAQKKLMPTANAELSTVKGKRGGNIYYGANATTVGFGKFSKDDQGQLLHFFESINSFNNGIMESYKTNKKLKEDSEDTILESRLVNNGSNT